MIFSKSSKSCMHTFDEPQPPLLYSIKTLPELLVSSTLEVAQPNCGLCFIIKTMYCGNALFFQWLPSLCNIINTWKW